jgi:uncharacterized membrane protein
MSLKLKKYLTKSELEVLSTDIAKAEKNTSGEIRVVVRHRRHWKERKLQLHDIALNEFHRLGMEKTRDRTGVLIMLLLSERKFQIVADEGIHTKVEEGTWERLASSMCNHFKGGKFYQGISETICAVGSELAKHFPRKPDDTDELSNEIIEQ